MTHVYHLARYWQKLYCMLFFQKEKKFFFFLEKQRKPTVCRDVYIKTTCFKLKFVAYLLLVWLYVCQEKKRKQKKHPFKSNTPQYAARMCEYVFLVLEL